MITLTHNSILVSSLPNKTRRGFEYEYLYREIECCQDLIKYGSW